MKFTALKGFFALIAFAGPLASAAEVRTYEINVGEFTELKVTNGIRVDYRVSEDSCGYAVFNASSDLPSWLRPTKTA